MVFAKNQDGGILPQTKRSQRNAIIAKGNAEIAQNKTKYNEDYAALSRLNDELKADGQVITDVSKRHDAANRVLADASDRAKSYGNQIAENNKTLEDFKLENEIIAAPTKMESITSGLKGMTSSFLSGLGNMAISSIQGIIVEKGLSLLISGIDHFVNRQKYAIEAGQEAADTIKEQNKAYNEQRTSLGDLTTKYSTLSKGVKIAGNTIKNVSLSDDQYQEFLDTSNQIANVAPTLTRTWDAQGNAILNAENSATTLNKQVSDYLKLQRSLTYYDARDNVEDQYNGYIASKEKAKDKIDGYDSNSKAAKNQQEIASRFSEQLKNGTTSTMVDNFGEKVKYFTLDYDTYEELFDQLAPAIKEDLADDENGNRRFVADLSELTQDDIKKISDRAAEISDTAASNWTGYENDKTAAQQTLDAEKKKLIASMSSMANTIDSFDNWADQDKADTFRDKLVSMMSSSNSDKLLNDWEKSGKSMDEWLRSNIVNPMASANSDQQGMWSKLFEMSPKEGETVADFAKRRDNVLEAIADFNDNDFWTKGTLAEAFGFAHTDEDGKLVWENKNKLDEIQGAIKKGDTDKLRNELNQSTPDELELAYSIKTSGNEDALASVEAFEKEWEKLKLEAKDNTDKASVSLDTMKTAVASAKTNLSSISTILTETTSAGGVSSDNRTSLMAMFSGVKNGDEEVNLNRLFSTTADGVKLNVDALKDYIHYQQEATDKKFSKGIENQIGDLKDLRDAWDNATGDEKDTALEDLKNAQDNYVAYMQQQSEWQAIKKQQDDLLSQYTQWQTAQSTENAGDRYNNIYSGLKNAKDAYDKGLVGTDDFKTFAALISPTGSDDAKNFAENYGKAVRYLTEDRTGVDNFLADLKAKGMASYNKSDDRWSFNIDDMDRAAQSLGIGTEFMKANFGRLRDYGIDNNFISSTEEGISRVKELSLALAEEEKRLDSLDDNLATNDTTRSASQKKIAQYKEDLKETTENLSEYYGEDYTQQAAADFDGAAIAVQQLDKSIDKVKKDSTLTAAEKNSMISKMIAEQTELAAEQYSSIEDLRNHDTSSLTEGLDTDSSATVSAIEQINQAYEDQNTEVTDLIDTLSQYSAEQLEGIDFNDGKWDTELGDAEKAVESLCEKLGLTKDQARSVIEALKEAGKLKDSEESSDSSKETTKGSWEKPQTAEQMGFGDDPDRAAEYTHSLEALTAAHKENDAATEKSFETLSKYNRTQLEGIKLNDGAYNVEGMEQAEDAIQQLADKTQLSKDQILTALEGLGILKVNTDTTDATKNLDSVVTEAKEAQNELTDLTGKTYKFDFDSTDLDSIHQQVTDLGTEVDKYRDRDGKYHPEITGGEELQTVYTGAISHEQDVEYNSSDISQADSSSSIVKAAQDFMQAKNEMDVQTQLYQKGMDNTLDQATQDANTAFETLQQAQTDSKVKLVDTDNIQTAEDQLLKISNDDITAKVDVEADTSEAESDIENLQNVSGSTVTLNCDVSNEGSFEQAKSTIESMPSDTTATIDMEINGEEDVEKATELIESAPTNGAKLVVDCEVNNKEEFDELMQAQSTANSKGANVEVHASIKGVDVDSAATADTEVPVKGKLEIEPYSGDAVEVNAKANITGVTGGEGVQVSLNAKANVTEAPTVPDTTVKATAHVDEAPTVPDAEGIANYEGIFPHVADDAYGVAHYEGDFPTSAPTISGTVNYYAHIIGAPSGGAIATASGTMTSVAHASGTAYNVLNMRPLSSAHAKGDVALKHDEQAIVNEVGINGHSESIVRDGVWSLIPGGAHIENLKKGDIIFSATQTEDLLKHGATHGHARAYAQGTAPRLSISPAFSSGSSSSTNTELDNKIKEVSTQAKDWINVALDRLERIVEKYKDTAESDYSNYRASIKAYNSALKNLKNQLKTQKDSRAKYVTKADEVASAVGLSDDLKKKVQNGTINIENLSEDDKKRVDAYQEWYEKILDCDKAIRQLTISQKDLAKAKVDRVIEAYDTYIGKRESKAEYYKAKQELRITQGYNQKPGSIYEKYIKNELSYTNKQKKLTDKEIKTYKGKMKEYLAENGHKTVDPEYQKMKKQLYDLETSAVKLENEAAQLRQALQDNREQIKQWAVDRWERAGSKQDAVINYKTVSDDPNYQIKEKDYTERIKTNNRQIIALQKLRAEKAEYYDSYFKSGNNEEAQKYLEAIAQIDEQILKLGASTEELKNQIMELRWKPFEDIQDDLSNVISEYQTMQKLLGDTESFYNDDGSFTENGLTNILLLQESIDVTKQKIANYREALDKLDEQYKNGCYSQEEYTEKSKELLNGLQQESAALSDLQQNMLTMYETQVKTENDLLQKNIDKRLEALDAKEKYYEYDKTLKKKSKDINTLKAQIAALEGTSNAAAKARLEKLKAELAESEEDMQDTVHNHETEMKKTGFENLQSDAEKALDNTLDALKKNTNFQQAVIGNMLSNVTANYDSTYSHLHDVMDQYGVQVSTTFDKMITKSANFNTSLVAQTKAMQDVINMATKLPANLGGAATDIVNNTAKVNGTSTGAGNVTPGKVNDTTYSLKLNASEIYLTYSHLKYSLKATWSPSKPEHSDIEWSSTDKSVAKVSTSGVVTGVAAPLSKLGLMSRDESLTRKCKIIANGGPGLAKAECTVHIMPDEHYNAIKQYADKVGIDTSKEGNNLREAMEYAYKNGAFRSNQSSTAVEGFQKAYLKDWFNALPDRPNGATDVPSGVSQLAGYFYSKGKQVTRNDMQKLADILQIKTPGVGSYDTWGGTLKNKILKAYKAYGYATGGVINRLVPANMETLLGKAIISNGDQGFIGAKVGETVMTEEFTRLLKPSIAAMSDFTNMFSATTPIATTNNDYSINNEVNINVASMSSDLDIQDVANKVSTIINKNMTRDWRKLR